MYHLELKMTEELSKHFFLILKVSLIFLKSLHAVCFYPDLLPKENKVIAVWSLTATDIDLEILSSFSFKVY